MFDIQSWPDLHHGDIAYVIGKPHPYRNELKGIFGAPWFKAFATIQREPIGHTFYIEEALFANYCSSMDEKSKEPSWTRTVSRNLRNAFRTRFTCSDEFDDVLAISGYRPHLNFAYVVIADGLIHDVCAALNVFRLENIRQLSYLHDPVMNEVPEISGAGMLFHHSRYMHSLDVMATATLMGLKCKLLPWELTHLRVAAISHDVLTPAGGDAVKFLDSSAFDEDLHYPEIFKSNPEWIAIRKRHELSEELLTSIVRGEGLLGQILDLADKSSYVAHDVEAYMMQGDPTKTTDYTSPESIIAVWNHLQRLNRPSCATWECVSRIGEEMFVTDPLRLSHFLTLRALLFKHLYNNPKARYREQMFATLIVDYLYAEQILSRKDLLTMNDWQLDRMIQGHMYKAPVNWALSLSRLAPTVKTYATKEEALEHARALVTSNPGVLTMIEGFGNPNQKALQMLTRAEGKRLAPFSEGHPLLAKKIHDIGHDPFPVKLYMFMPNQLDGVVPPKLLKKLLVRQRVRVGL